MLYAAFVKVQNQLFVWKTILNQITKTVLWLQAMEVTKAGISII